jgi:hypothetical protein
MPTDQVAVADWADYHAPVQVLVAGRTHLSSPQRLAFYRTTLDHFFNLLKKDGLDIDDDESFCVLAYKNRSIVAIRSVHDQDELGLTSGLDKLRQTNLSLYRVTYDLLVALKHKRNHEWGLAYEATDRALTRLVYRQSNPAFCSYEDQDVGLDRRLWGVVVWIVMERLDVDQDQTLLEWCKANKDLIDEAVKQVGGHSIRQSRLGRLDCRGKSKDIAASCRTEEELRSVIRPSVIGDNFRTIHKAKGIQREGVLVFAEDSDEVERWLFSSRIAEDESSRRGYVAFSRARKILCIACHSLSAEQESKLQDRGVKTVPLRGQQLTLL